MLITSYGLPIIMKMPHLLQLASSTIHVTSSGKLKPEPVYACASTGRFEATLLETVRDLVRE